MRNEDRYYRGWRIDKARRRSLSKYYAWSPEAQGEPASIGGYIKPLIDTKLKSIKNRIDKIMEAV